MLLVGYWGYLLRPENVGRRVRKERGSGRNPGQKEGGSESLEFFFLATAQGRGGKDSEFFRNENQDRGHFFL